MRPAPDTAAVALGALTILAASLAAVLTGGPDAAVAPRALVAGLVSLAGLAATVAAFLVALSRSPIRRRAGVGLVLALLAWPVAGVLGSAAALAH